MFTAELLAQATDVLAKARARGLKLATAESCTGGLISALLTEVAGSSDVFERGFVTYSNEAKQELLGVPEDLIAANGAVSQPVASAMAKGALNHSAANAAVAVTGIAGPGGGTPEKPVGLVYIATIMRPEIAMRAEMCAVSIAECRFGELGRETVRLKTVEAALRLLQSFLSP